MKNLIKISDIAEKKAFDNSLSFFLYAKGTWGVQINISKESYTNLLHGIYQIHAIHKKTYQYEENIKKYLEMALINSIEDRSYTIKKESILDGIFDIETKTEEEIKLKQKKLLKRTHY